MSLTVVKIETSMESVYEFPDMDSTVVESLFSERGINTFANMGCISLVNISKACLVLPFRILEAIYVDGVERWRSPASTATNP